MLKAHLKLFLYQHKVIVCYLPAILQLFCSLIIPTDIFFLLRSVLAVLFRTNKLCFYTSEKNTWLEIVNLSELHSAQLKKEDFFKENLTMRGKIPPDLRVTVGSEGTWETFKEWQNQKYLSNFTCIEWCPEPITCPNALRKTKSKFAFLATVVKSGNLFIWQALLPLMEHSGSSVQRVLAANTSLFYPCSLAWSSVASDGSMN